ncbi:uncharacterized protein [Branchiostoma lanceolatum]|uniref:uncharacterized protein isoform X2 n=1 Tax=Branchiostoma lanceolatum TaxID=7740 RepID=UPI003453CC20
MAEASSEGEGESPSLDRSLQMNMFDCSICLQMFTRPKVLPCGHTFCKDCLVTYVKDGWSCKCPTCKRPAYLNGKKGSEGVESLTDNISLGNLRDDFASLTIINKQGREVERHVQLTNQQVCVKHYGMEVKFYCPSCEEVICGECIVDEHNTHGVTRLSKALEKQAEQAKELMGEGKRWIEQVRGKITETEEARKMLKFEEETQCLLVNKSAACLKKVLTESVDKRATDIKEELNALFALKRVALTNCKEELETLLATLLNGVEEVARCIFSEETIPLIRGRKVLQEVIQPLPGRTLLLGDEQDSSPFFAPSLFDVPAVLLGTVRSAKKPGTSPPKMTAYSFGAVQNARPSSTSPPNLLACPLRTVQNAPNSSTSPLNMSARPRRTVESDMISSRTVQSARKPVVSKSPETTSAVEEFIQSVTRLKDVQVLLQEQATSDEVSSPPSWMPNHSSATGTHTPQPLAQPKPARKEWTEQQQPAVFRARQGQGPRRQLHVKRGTKKVVKPKDAVAKSLISEVPRRGNGNGGSEPIPPHSDSSDASNSQTDVMPIVADSSVEDSSASAKVSASSEGAAATFKFDDANGNSSDLDI